MQKIAITFYGVRGSTPAPSKQMIKYGGNTPCLTIRAGDQLIICDAGTGIQTLGQQLYKKRSPLKATILLSHVHWDHISGLPFFHPLYQKKNRFQIVGPKLERKEIKSHLLHAIEPPYFPVSLNDVDARLTFKSVTDRAFRLGKIFIVPLWVNHPDGALGWRFHFPNKKTLLYVSDNEPMGDSELFYHWMKDADLLIHDAQFTPKEYKKHKGWGHSPYTFPVRLASDAGVKRLILNHFSPTHTDRDLERILKAAKREVKKSRAKLSVSLAREGKTFYL